MNHVIILSLRHNFRIFISIRLLVLLQRIFRQVHHVHRPPPLYISIKMHTRFRERLHWSMSVSAGSRERESWNGNNKSLLKRRGNAKRNVKERGNDNAKLDYACIGLHPHLLSAIVITLICPTCLPTASQIIRATVFLRLLRLR